MIIALSFTDAAVNRDVACVRPTPASVGLTAICRLPVRFIVIVSSLTCTWVMRGWQSQRESAAAVWSLDILLLLITTDLRAKLLVTVTTCRSQQPTAKQGGWVLMSCYGSPLAAFHAPHWPLLTHLSVSCTFVIREVGWLSCIFM